MIYLKLRQEGLLVNHKRVDRLYALEGLQVRRRKRKKIPVADRCPLGRPSAANRVWSMDFVFDRTADGRVVKCLTIVDDATHEAVAIAADRGINGKAVTRILDRLALVRGLPQALRTDNGKEFCGKAMAVEHDGSRRPLGDLIGEAGILINGTFQNPASRGGNWAKCALPSSENRRFS